MERQDRMAAQDGMAAQDSVAAQDRATAPRRAGSQHRGRLLPARADHRRVVAAGIAALVLTVGLARFAYTPMLPVMQHEAGLSAVAGGWLATFNYAGYLTGALIAARTRHLATKFLFYRIGLVAAAVTTLAMGFTDNVFLWAALRFVSGLSSTAGLLLASGLVLNWLIRERLRPELGLHFAGMGLGIVVSGLAVTPFTGLLAWNGLWLLLGVIGLVFFLPAWFWMPAPVAMSGHGALVAPPPPSRRWMGLIVAAYFCAGFGYVISATFLVAIVEHLPLFAGRGGWVWVMVGLAALPSTFFWDRVAAALGGIRTLIVCYLLQIASFLFALMSDSAAAALAGGFLYGSTFVGIVSLTLAIVGRCYPANPARAMARMTLSYGAAQIIAPAMAGYIAALSGSYAGALAAAAAVMALGIGLLLMAGERPSAA